MRNGRPAHVNFWCMLLGLLIICVQGHCSLPVTRKEPDKVVCVVNQPLSSTDIPFVMSQLNTGKDAAQLKRCIFLTGTSAWIFVPFAQLSRDTTRKYLVTGYQDYMDIYERKGSTWVKLRTTGKYTSFAPSAEKERNYVKLFNTFPSDTTSAFLVVCRKNNNYFFSDLSADLKTEAELATWQAEFREHAETYPKLTLPFFGISLTTIILLLVKFVLSKDRAYSFNATGHIFFLIFFILLYFQYPVNLDKGPIQNPLLAVYLDKFFLFLSISCLLLSIRFFYQSGKWAKRNNRFINILATTSTIIAFSLLIITQISERFYLINNGCMIAATIITLLLSIHLIMIRSEIKGAFKTIVIGLAVLVFFVYLGFGLVFFLSGRVQIGFEVLQAFPMLVGVGFSNIFIIIAFVKREHQIQQESLELKAKAYEAEMSVVQRSLNPHFIFNCLNFIDSFLYANNSQSARKVLFDFSDLLRMVIDKSPKRLISLREEMRMLELYVSLVKSRSDQQFTFTTVLDHLEDISLIQVPPLIIQPIVENAIKHGILNRKSPGGSVCVKIKSEEPFLLKIEIDDDGIGMSAAKTFQPSARQQNGHFGISLTRKRLEIMSEIFQVESRLEVVEKSGIEMGTTVVLWLPLIKSE